jgi:hypothetical protein
MFSNGVRVPYVARINQEGYLAHSMWVWNDYDESHAKHLEILVSPEQERQWSSYASQPSYSRGEAIFRGECGSCHTLAGYRPLKTLLAGRDSANIASFITMLHEYKPDSPYRRFMPPMTGTKQDVDDLANYLNYQVNPPAPAAKKATLTAQK